MPDDATVAQGLPGGRLEGRIILPSMPGASLIACLGVTFVVAGLTFASVAPLSVTVAARGSLTPEGGMIRLTAQQGGEVASVQVVEGAFVQTGQIIAVMNLAPALPQGDAGEAVMVQFREEQQGAQASAAADLLRLYTERSRLVAKQQSLATELSETRNQQRIAHEQYEIAQAELSRSEEIAARGYLTRRDLDARRSSTLAAEARRSQVVNAVHTLERELADTRSELALIPVQISSANAAARVVGAQLDQRQTEAAAHNGYLVKAPVSGRLMRLDASAGASVEAGGEIAMIYPQGASLEAELFVPAEAIGSLRVGQQVNLRYRAFSYRTFGAALGRISNLSNVGTTMGTAASGAPTPLYRVTVDIPSELVRAWGESRPLTPDMPVDADIVIDKRTAFQLLFAPLARRGPTN